MSLVGIMVSTILHLRIHKAAVALPTRSRSRTRISNSTRISNRP